MGGRRAELDLEILSWADFWRACSSAMRESMASRRRWEAGSLVWEGRPVAHVAEFAWAMLRGRTYLKHHHGRSFDHQDHQIKAAEEKKGVDAEELGDEWQSGGGSGSTERVSALEAVSQARRVVNLPCGMPRQQRIAHVSFDSLSRPCLACGVGLLWS